MLALLVSFLGWSQERSLLDFFEHEMPPDRANVGRWSSEIDPAQRAEFDEHYRRVLSELREDGSRCRDLYDEVMGRHA